MDDPPALTLISFNLEEPEEDSEDEGVISKFLTKVKSAVGGASPPAIGSQDQNAGSTSSIASARKNSNVSIASLKSSQHPPQPLQQPSSSQNQPQSDEVSRETDATLQDLSNKLKITPSTPTSNLQRHIYVTSPTPPTSVKDSVVLNFHAAGSTPSASSAPVQSESTVSKQSSHEDPSHSFMPSDHYLGVPISKQGSIDSDTQSVMTNFSISNTNSLTRILARLRGYRRSDKEFWMRDEKCKECYKCRKQFTLLRRKHHCRACGQIFCGKCASHIMSGDLYGIKEDVRLCNFCFSERHIDVPGDSSTLQYSINSDNASTAVPSMQAEDYSPVIPTQKPPLEVPNMQIPTTALRQTRSVYGNGNATTLAFEIHTEELQRNASVSESVPKRYSGGSVSWRSSFPAAIGANNESENLATEGSLRRWIDAGTSMLRARPRSHTTSSAPHYGGSVMPFRGSMPSPSIPFADRGGGTILAESELSPFMGHKDLDDDSDSRSDDNRPYDIWNGVENYQSLSSPKIPTLLTSPVNQLRDSPIIPMRSVSYESAESDDEAYSHRLRDKRTEELRGSSNLSRDRSLSAIRRQSLNSPSVPRNSMRSRKIFINTANLPRSDSAQSETWSPNPFLSPFTSMQDDKFSPSTPDYNIMKPRLAIRQRRNSTPTHTEFTPEVVDHARKLLRQLMDEYGLQDLSDAERENWEGIIMNLVYKVIDNVRPDIHAGDDMDIRHYLKIKRIPGGLPSDSHYVKGVVCSKNVAHKKMIRNMANPRILILLFSLDYSRAEMDNQLLSISPVISQEREFISKLVARIVLHRPSLLIVKSTVCRLALEHLLEANITVIHNVKPSVIDAVSRCTQARVLTSIDMLTMDLDLSTGRCGTFEIRTFMHEWIPNRRKTYLIFGDCPPELGGTIVLRGSTDESLHKIKRVIDFMVFVVNNLKFEVSYLRDAFARIRTSDLPMMYSSDMYKSDRSRSPLVPDFETDKETVDDEEPKEPKEIQDGSDENQKEDSSLGAIIKKYSNAILSASQNVYFPPPTLLTRLKDTEDRLAVLGTKRKSSTKISDQVDSGVDAEYEYLVARHHQLTRAWDAYLGGGNEDFYLSPIHHQSLVVLYSNVCTITTVPCQGPQIRKFDYYKYPSDMTIGQYVVDLCADAEEPCTSAMCDQKMMMHYRSYAHGEARVNVMIEAFACPDPGNEDKLYMWSYCRECSRPTPAVPVAEETQNYSFGKFLELFLYQRGMGCRSDICTHEIAGNHVRYFGYRNLSVRFQYDVIDLLEVSVPPMKLFMLSQVHINLKEAAFQTLRSKINRFYQSIEERNKAFPFDLVNPRKLDLCKSQLQEMSHRCVGTKKQVLQILQNVYATTEASDSLTINWVRRILYQQVSQWEEEYADLVRRYLQPERELRKITTNQLRKMFPSDVPVLASGMDDERTKRATEMTDLPLLGIGLDGEDERMMTGRNIKIPENESAEENAYLSPRLLPMISFSPSLSPADSDSLLTNTPDTMNVMGEKSTHDTIKGERPSLLCPESRRQFSIDLTRELNEKFGRSGHDRMAVTQAPKGPPSSALSMVPSRIGIPQLNTSRLPIVPPLFEPFVASNGRARPWAAQMNMPAGLDRFVSLPGRSSTTSRKKGKEPVYYHQPPRIKPLPSVFGRLQPEDPVMPSPLRKAALSLMDNKRTPFGSSTRDRQFRSRLPRKKTYIQVYSQANDLVREDIDEEFLLDDVEEQVMSQHRFSALDVLPNWPFDDEEEDNGSENGMRNPSVDYFSPMAPYMDSSTPSKRARARPRSASDSSVLNEPSQMLTGFGMDLDHNFLGNHDIFTPPPSAAAMITDKSPPLTEELPATLSEHTQHTTPPLPPPPEDAATSSQPPSLAEHSSPPPQRQQSAEVEMVDSPVSIDHDSSLSMRTDPQEDKPLPEKISFMKTITSFLTDSGTANLLPLEIPLQPTEHVFPDSFVVVREDEPSTIIAYTLSGEDYLTKIHEMGDTVSADVDTTEDIAQDALSSATTIDMETASADVIIAQPSVIQETLLRESGTHMRYNFSDGTTKFFCKIFFAEQFDALRRNCGCDESFIMSLSSCIKWDSSGGKSGSTFLKTKDDRLMMKQMSRYELDAFLGFAPAYFQYMSQAFFQELPTVLAKIFGFYSIGYKNSATGKSMRMDVLVMENLFYQRNIIKIFDLKGSMRNRHVQSTGKQDEVLLDENLVELIYQSPLFIRAHSKEILRSSLHNDTLFLSSRNVMDYSLLVGIDEERQELVVGIVDFIRTFTWDKKLESWVKESGILGGGGKEPTILSPRQYRIRFREAMERYFLMVPDVWAQTRQNRLLHFTHFHHHAG